VIAPTTWNGDERLTLDALERELQSPSHADDTWHARLVTLGGSAETVDLHTLGAAHGVRVVDTIARQLDDLAFTQFSAPTATAARATFVQEQLFTAGDAACYGVWAWLPWLRTIVHVLPPDAFFRVITNRNQDKLTRAEQDLLRTKCIGVIGLSVGGEAAVTVAQEHLCGHLVLADFDQLDLSNLNRIGSGIDELSVNKAVIVARPGRAHQPLPQGHLVPRRRGPDEPASLSHGT
jgi:tRNA threonylcarbamoyladenosine dehydratase